MSEADTVTVVKDLLSEVLGYDKYAELTSEHCIRGTFCDLAVKIEDKLVLRGKDRRVGTRRSPVKQAIDYASNQGVERVILTNATIWRLYQVIFAKPIDKRLLTEIDLATIETRKDEHLERIYLLTKEGFAKGAHIELRDKQDATSRYTLAASSEIRLKGPRTGRRGGGGRGGPRLPRLALAPAARKSPKSATRSARI